MRLPCLLCMLLMLALAVPACAAPGAGPAGSPAQESGTTNGALPPLCSCNAAGDAASPAPALQRGRLQAARWEDIQTLEADTLFTPSAWQALLLGCTVLTDDPAWTDSCAAAGRLPKLPDPETRRAFLHAWLLPWQALGADGQTEGLATGYYEPLLHGSRHPDARHRYALYGPPDDLLTVELDALVPELKGRRVRARLDGKRLLPYYTRAEIESKPPDSLRGHELVWLDDPVETAFLHIQGSGRVVFDDGSSIHVGYADQNGQAFRSVARQLILHGELKPAQATLQGMRAWAQAHPDKIEEWLNTNPSYVFFKEIAGDLPGPLGTLKVPLLGEATVAVDARVVPLGAPLLVDTTVPLGDIPWRRVVMAQDTGGAINGAVRVDVFWGVGDDALAQAGRMRQKLRLWALLPRGFHPQDGQLIPDASAVPGDEPPIATPLVERSGR